MNTPTTHTPGPWQTGALMTRVEVWPKGWKVPLTIADCHPEKGYCSSEEHERVANARLIAAAPELLEALRDLLAWSGIPDNGSKDAVLLRNQARSAIARATESEASK